LLPELPLDLYSKNTEQQTLEFLTSTYSPIFEERKINLKKATAIYEHYDWLCGFALYLRHCGISYVHFDSVPNRQVFTKPLVMNAVRCSKGMNNLLKKLSSVDENNKVVNKIMIFPSTKFFDNQLLAESERQLIEIFDFDKQFDLINESDKQKILSCFNIDINFLQNKSISMLLPSSTGFTHLLSKNHNVAFKDILYNKDKYLFLYTTILEYFANRQNEITYHPHPTRESSITSLEPLKQRGVKYVDANMPIEFCQWIPNVKIKQLLLVESGSKAKLETMVDEVVALNREYVKVFNILDRLYIIQQIIDGLTLYKNIKIYGIPQKIFETMYKFNFDEYLYKKFAQIKTLQNAKLQTNDILVINTTLNEIEPISKQNFILDMLEKSEENSLIFFTNIFNESAFVPLLSSKNFLLDFIVPIQISRTPLDDGEQIGEIGTIAIFAFCKNAETRQYLRKIQLTKNLQYLNVVLNVSPISEETAQSWLQQAYNNAVTAAIVHNYNSKIIKRKNDEIQQNAENQQIIQRKNEEIDNLKNRISQLETSTSWKITRPLRRLKKLFGNLSE